MSRFIKTTTRVHNLRFKEAWASLTEKEQNYAYCLSKAAWAGAQMVPHQISREAPLLMSLFQLYFQGGDYSSLKQAALENQVTEQEYEQFMAYVAGCYSNMGNYHSFGHNKFVPEMSREVFQQILLSNPRAKSEPVYREWVDRLTDPLQAIYKDQAPYDQLNFPHKGGLTAYFSDNMTEQDLQLCRSFMKQEQIDPLNTRFFKHSEQQYEVTVGCIQQESRVVDYQGNEFRVTKGEFKGFLEETVRWLQEGLEYCANETQRTMLQHYIRHYQEGDIDVHKQSQVEWIKDKAPVVESNQGWIEVYVDPENIRGYFESWVAIVDKPKSHKFQQLVQMSEQIIPKLPWPSIMEKESFLAPDFTTLEVIAFATNGCPLGINIPNYDDIRETIGFKNVYLDNRRPQIDPASIQFATQEQAQLLACLGARSYVVHVACHELLGHGTGRNLYRQPDGSDYEFIDPLSGETFRSCYEKDETWNQRFGAISASYEECRADTCGFYLAVLPEVYSLFGIKEEEAEDMIWCSVMAQLRKGLLGLPLFNPDKNKWGQAHTQGAYVFTQFLLQNQTTPIVQLEVTSDSFLIHLSKEHLLKEGQVLISKLLVALQTYKSSGDVQRAEQFYQKYSEVDEQCMAIRDRVLAKKEPRPLVLNNNLVRRDGKVEVQEYPDTHEGIIASFQDRYGAQEDMLQTRYQEWVRYSSRLGQ